ncbi:MAG TPA: diacylglycerol kinase family protein [Pseudonocardiaceae bacterium]|nr:diacylglycerol kinase family protein [Pseudonocardiaceae bacterium]
MLALLVVNPQATATTAAGRDVLAHALASDTKLEVLETSYRGHAADAAAQAAADGFDLVVAHGGDGTVNEVVNGLMRGGVGTEHRLPMLGVVPGGSANVFARALGLPRDPLDATHQLLQAIEGGRSRSVGLGKANGRWFTFNAGVGWDAEVVASVDGLRRKQASPALYGRATLASYARQALRGPQLTIELPGAPPGYRVLEGLRLALICNTDPWTYLGRRPVRLLPNCSFDRGLSLFGLRNLRLPTVLRHVGQALRGAAEPHGPHLVIRDDQPLIRVMSDRPVKFQVDGDLAGEQKSVEFTAVPDALQVAV